MDEITHLLSQHGIALVFANVLLTQLGAPVPAVPMLIMAGAYAQQGGFDVATVLATAVVASLLGDLPWYAAGRRYGYSVLSFLCRVAVEPGICVQRTEDKLSRWGAPSLMIAKFVPGFATVAPPLAGATRMSLASFLGYSAIGAALWAGAAVATGALFRTQVEQVIAWIEIAGLRAGAVLGAVLLLYVAVKWTQRFLFMRVLRMARVSAHDLHTMMRSEAPPVILDARSEAARRADPRHIPGAIPVELGRPEVAVAQVPIGRDVVIYCT
jgi:membrane protein DedA with SNARE-associated domain